LASVVRPRRECDSDQQESVVTVDVEVVGVEAQAARSTLGDDLKPVAMWNVEQRDHSLVDRVRNRIELCFGAAFE
jgi:hypothetical protein